MDLILRGAAVYLFVLVVFRIAGKRTLMETTSFDLVLLLIISETTQQAMVGDDRSLTGAAVLIATLVGIDILLSLVKQRSPLIERWLDGRPLIIVRQGRPLLDRMNRERVDENDILEAGRNQGLTSMAQIDCAVLECNGKINIVPRAQDRD